MVEVWKCPARLGEPGALRDVESVGTLASLDNHDVPRNSSGLTTLGCGKYTGHGTKKGYICSSSCPKGGGLTRLKPTPLPYKLFVGRGVKSQTEEVPYEYDASAPLTFERSDLSSRGERRGLFLL